MTSSTCLRGSSCTHMFDIRVDKLVATKIIVNVGHMYACLPSNMVGYTMLAAASRCYTTSDCCQLQSLPPKHMYYAHRNAHLMWLEASIFASSPCNSYVSNTFTLCLNICHAGTTYHGYPRTPPLLNGRIGSTHRTCAIPLV